MAWHGVPCIVVERHPDLLIHPRLRAVLPRTVELFRQVGLEPAIQAAMSLDGGRSTWAPIRAETLASDNYATIVEGSEDDSLIAASPSPFAGIDQDKLEVLLRDKARELGADVRFSTELTSFEQHADGVDAVLEDRRIGVEHTVQAQYLIAADGAQAHYADSSASTWTDRDHCLIKSPPSCGRRPPSGVARPPGLHRLPAAAPTLHRPARP